MEVMHGGCDLTPTAPKLRLVLAMLLLARGRTVQTRSLFAEIWGEHPPPSAQTTLQTYVYQLRKAFAPVVREGEPDLLLTRGAGYLIHVPDSRVDVFEFERLTLEGQRALARGDERAAEALLRRGLELWRGPALLDVVVGTALEAQVARLDETRLRALELWIDANLQLGRHGGLVSELRALISDHPLHEGLHARLMLALYRCSRRSEALDVYRRLRRTTVAELGLEPATEIATLHRRILNGDPSLDQVPHGTTAARPPETDGATRQRPEPAAGTPLRRPGSGGWLTDPRLPVPAW
jgi:DNA-binding SARP family transcriptional activator